MRLRDKVAVVTGGATGIGSAIARAFAREGARIVLDHRDQSGLAAEVITAIEQSGGSAVAVDADVTNPDAVDRLIQQAMETFGRLDILVNNAAYQHKVPLLETPLDLWHKTIATNLTGPWLCLQAAARQMVARAEGGRIINISSVHEEITATSNAPYCASKGGLRMLMRCAAEELAGHGITVNNIGPGAIDTRMTAHVHDNHAVLDRLIGKIPLRRMGQPEEVAELAVYLASEAAAYITGATFFIDGGLRRRT
jgi:glucose 1-dehydrogenase